MPSTYRQVALEAQVSVPADTATADALLAHLSSLADVAYPQEIVTIETVNIVQRQLVANDDNFYDELDPEVGEFEYDDLAEDEIRLIKLSRAQTGSVELQLESFSLSSAPPYDALSYKWETESELRKSSVICNGCRFMLSPDLHVALHRVYLLQSLVEHGTEHIMYLWNDFTCINQRNIKEREVQVSKMADIYAGAQRAIVWLGPADRLSNFALLSISGILGRLSEHEALLTNTGLETAGLENMALWEAYGEFFHKPWFERLWVLQEAVLAPYITLICGEIAVDWAVLSTLVGAFANAGLYRLASGEHGWDERKSKHNGLVTIPDINKLRKICQDNDRVISVPHLMDVAWGKQCLEQVDHVWAVVGLLPDFMRRNLFAQGFVDYSEDGRKNYENTYIKTAKWLAELDLSGMLSMAARSEKSDKIPTWCPDWSVIPRCSNLGMYYSMAGVPKEKQEAQNRQRETYGQNDNEPPLDDATGAYITWSWEHNVLCIAGYRVDVIDMFTEDVWVSSSTSTEDELIPRASEMLAWQAQAIAVTQTILQENEECLKLSPQDSMLIPNRFWKVITGGRKFTSASSVDHIPAPDTATGLGDGELTKDDYIAWFFYMIGVASGDDLEKLDRRMLEHAMRFGAVADSVCAGRKLAATMHGRLAVVPPDVERGDIICIFYGGWVPYILRSPRDGTPCRFIGDAYVDGLMDSESLCFKVNPEGPLHRDERGLNELFPIL